MQDKHKAVDPSPFWLGVEHHCHYMLQPPPIQTKASASDLQGVCEEVMVEHGPVLATDVHDDFAQLVADEVRHDFVLGQQQLWQTVADLHLVLGSYAQPLLIHQVLKGTKC